MATADINSAHSLRDATERTVKAGYRIKEIVLGRDPRHALRDHLRTALLQGEINALFPRCSKLIHHLAAERCFS